VGIQGVSSFANISIFTLNYTSQVAMNALLAQAASPDIRQALREFYENKNIKSSKSKRRLIWLGAGRRIEQNTDVTRVGGGGGACRHFPECLRVFIFCLFKLILFRRETLFG
jgi:hypothetical protein